MASQQSQSSATQRAMDAIETYLARHPDAADSEAGIGDWWLAEMGVDVSTRELQDALDTLVQRGSLQGTRLPDGTVIYRAPRAPSA